jgi:phytanoyl-CoA hydroxylase
MINTKLIKEYKNSGFFVLKKFLSKVELKKCSKSLEIYANKYRPKKNRKINFTKNNVINSIHDLDKWIWIKKLRNKFKQKYSIEKIIGSKSKNFGSEYFAKPAKYGLESPPHQDNFYWCVNNDEGITVWISLDKVSKKNGGVYYYQGSHKLGLLNHKPSLAPGSSQTIMSFDKLKIHKIITPKLSPGDCIIHNSLVVHGSNKNNSNMSRRGITLRFIPSGSKISKNQKKNYEKSLKKQIEKRI